jgi:hypothetical protein
MHHIILYEGIFINKLLNTNAIDVNNFKGITLISMFGKLCSLILNQRLMLWTQLHEYITQFQFGFQSQKSTIDCMCVLHSIIAKVLSNGDNLYCAFVDFF